MVRNIRLSAFALAWLPLTWACCADNFTSDVINLVESKPIQVNDVEFVAITQEKWAFANTPQIPKTIEIQLRITNHGKKDWIFSNPNLFELKIASMDGTSVPVWSKNIGTAVIKPVLIRSGTTYYFCRRSMIIGDQNNSTTLLYLGESHFYPIYPGNYQLSFVFSGDTPDVGTPRKEWEDFAIWHRQASTQWIQFQVTKE